MIDATADIQQATAAARADVVSILQKINGLALVIGGKEILQYALQHLFVR